MKLKGLRVLIVADVSAEFVHGGAERMLYHHIRACCDAGAHVTVLTRQPKDGAELLFKLEHGVVEHRLPFGGDKGWRGLYQLCKEADMWWQLHQQFDVVLAEQPFVMWALMRAGCKLPRVQVCHSFAFEEYATRHGLDWNLKHRMVTMMMRRLEASVYTSAKSHVVLSQFMQQRLHDFFNIAQARIHIAAGGIDTFPLSWNQRSHTRKTIWGEQSDAPLIVTLRNLVPRTGVDLLIQAAAIVHVDRPDVRWLVMGSGSLLEPLKRLTHTLGMDDVVEMAGFVSEKEVHQRLWTADLFMLPTRSLEGFGLVTLEANAHGLPVVATPVGANPDVVGWHALNKVADDATPEALAKAVLQSLNNFPQEVEREGLAKETVAHFAWSKHDTAVVDALKRLE